jgi:hypothetical protein
LAAHPVDADAPVRHASRLTTLRRPVVVLVLVVALGAWLRLDGGNWDSGIHAHPDERFLSLVANAIQLPGSVGQYLDVERSPLSPYRTDSGRSYLYGTLPLFATKVVAEAIGQGAYDRLYLVGRHLSALVDVATILLVFLLARALLADLGRSRATRFALLAAAFYATAVVAIQHSHFFTVESWLTALTTLTLLLAARLAGVPRGRARMLLVAATGAAAGLTAACKLTGLLVLAPFVLAVVWGVRRPRTVKQAVTVLADVTADLLVGMLVAYVAFRFTSPYAFASSNWLDLHLNSDLREALHQQSLAVSGASMQPPNLQWLRSTPLLDPLANLLLWAVPAAGVLGLAGAAVAGGGVIRDRRGPSRPGSAAGVLAAVFVVLVVGWFATRFAHPLRYMLPAVPALCALAALALARLDAWRPRLAAAVTAASLALAVWWAGAFTSIYRRPHTHVEAAAWIRSHVPRGARIAFEHWDEGLPVDGLRYRTVNAPVFDTDDDLKVEHLYTSVMESDYYVIVSPRALWTVGRLPGRFPLTATFYRRLLAGELEFKRVGTFRSDPSLLGLTVRDTGAEEAQWVYDHPPVLVFKRVARLSRRAFAARLGGER